MRPTILALMMTLLAGCAATTYGPANGLGGYSNKQITDDSWEVTYRSNYRTADGYALSGALYRSAELAKGAGFPYFQIVRFRGTTTEVGMRGSSTGSYAGQTVQLKIRGAHTPNSEMACEDEDPRECRTLATDVVLRELDSVIWNRPPAGS